MGRIPRVARRRYQPQHLWAKHHEIKRLDLLGIAPNKIAEMVGCTPENVCQIRGGELYKAEIQPLQFARDCATVEISQAIMKEGPKCLRLLTAVRDGKVDGEHVPISLRATVAQDLLDRSAKTAKVKQISGDIRHAHVVVETTIERIKARAREIEQACMEDAEVVAS